MQLEESSSRDEPPPARLSSKQFISPGKGHWRDVSDADWNDHRWQLQHRLTNLNQISALLRLTPEEEAGFKLTETE